MRTLIVLFAIAAIAGCNKSEPSRPLTAAEAPFVGQWSAVAAKAEDLAAVETARRTVLQLSSDGSYAMEHYSSNLGDGPVVVMNGVWSFAGSKLTLTPRSQTTYEQGRPTTVDAFGNPEELTWQEYAGELVPEPKQTALGQIHFRRQATGSK